MGTAIVGVCSTKYLVAAAFPIIAAACAAAGVAWSTAQLQTNIENAIDTNYLKNTALLNLSKGFATSLKMTTSVKQWVSSNGNSSSGPYTEVSFDLIY